jgi:hypothetical protein
MRNGQLALHLRKQGMQMSVNIVLLAAATPWVRHYTCLGCAICWPLLAGRLTAMCHAQAIVASACAGTAAAF